MEPPAASRRWHPRDEEDYQAASADLKERFASWVKVEGVEVDPESADPILHYKWNYLDGHLTRWTWDDLSELYLEVYPARVMVDDGDLARPLEEGTEFLLFLAAVGLLDDESAPIVALTDHLERIEPELRRVMADPSRYSMGKRLWTQARAEGVQPDDREAVEAFIKRFNARPFAERDAVLGPPLSSARPSSGRTTPLGTRPRPVSSSRRKRRR